MTDAVRDSYDARAKEYACSTSRRSSMRILAKTRTVTRIPTPTVITDEWERTAAQIKRSAAVYMGWRIRRYGPRWMTS